MVIETGFKSSQYARIMKKMTIANIAELVGVSKATVSRVLNGYPHVRPEVRERVQRMIEETGFQPNNVARLLASDRSNMIGLIIPTGPHEVFTDPYFPVLTQGISQVANQNDQTLALFLVGSEQEVLDTIHKVIATGLLDGLIVTADIRDHLFIPQLSECGLPFVMIGRPTDPDGINFIDVDNLGGAFMATEHLIKLGYHRIGTVTAEENAPSLDRFEGYQQALKQYDLPFYPELAAIGDYSLQSGYDAAMKLIPHRPEAIFVASDTMALGTLRALKEAGLRVPEDVGVVGFDDLPPAVQADPQLTTIRQPIKRIGQMAVETLIENIADPDRPLRQVYLPNELIVRASCGARRLSQAEL
ncbi:MAG: LacI family DNA-binding transcriptional regulator [Anaerolineae bacterium]|nr:LacI family DNA-binding transcriptional regulator [Anaerolineae bacterium]